MNRSITIFSSLLLALVFSTITLAQPANDDCSGATVVTALPFHLVENTRVATPNPTDPPLLCADSGGGKTVWFTYTADTTRYVTFSSAGSTNGTAVYDVAFGLYTGTCGALVQVACNDDIDAGNVRQSEITYFVQAGTTYILQVAEWNGGGPNGGVPTGGDLNFNVYVSVLDTVRGPRTGHVAGGVTVSTNSFSEAMLEKPSERRAIENELQEKLLKPPSNMKAPLAPRGSNLFPDRPAPKLSSVMSGTSQPVVIKNYQGIPDQGVTIPPDPIMAVGPNHIVSCVNSRFRISDKSGNTLKTIEADAWLNGALSGVGPFDPQVVYDHYDNRWVMLWDNVFTNTAHILLSVSDDDDPLGTWYTWVLPAHHLGDSTVDRWSDYPGLGYDSLALYICSNDFPNVGSGATFSRVRIVPKAQLYANTAGPITYTDFWDFRDPDNISVVISTIRASQTWGSPGAAFFLNGSPYDPGTFMTLWKLYDPAGSPSFTATNVPVVEYTGAPGASQLGGGAEAIEIGIGLNRLQGQPVYRDSSLYCVRTVGSGPNSEYSAVSYLRINPFADTTIEDYALGTNGFWYFYPSLMTDKDHNVIMTYSRSGLTEYVGTFASGRKAADAPGLSPSVPIKGGEANYQKDFGSGRNRFGDYSGTGLDPNDLNAIWTLNEYAAAPGNTWGTWLGQLKMAPVPGKYIFGTPTAMTFGTHELGTTSDTQSVVVTNFGTDSLTVSSLDALDSNFALISAPAFPVTLGSFGSITLQFSFTPKNVGDRVDTVSLHSDDTSRPVIPIALAGKGFFITVAQPGTMYASGGSPLGNLFTVNNYSGAAAAVGSSGYDQLTRVRVRPSNHEIVGLVPNGTNMSVVRVNSLAGDAHPISTIPVTIIKAMALRGDTMYVARLSGAIYQVDMNTGAATLIANTGLVVGGMDFNPVTGELWMAGTVPNGNPDRIYKIALPSGTKTFVGNTGLGITTNDLLFDAAGNLFGMTSPAASTGNLLLIDTATAAASVVGSMGVNGVLGIGLDPSASFYAHTYRLDSSWNLASLPIQLPSYLKSTVFPGAASRAFFYEGSYVERDTLTHGKGFWLKYSGAAIRNFTGIPILNDTVPVSDKWNIVGSLGVNVPIGLVTTTPGGLINSNFFKYQPGSGYLLADSIVTGRGYWVRTTGAGSMTLASSGNVPKESGVAADLSFLDGASYLTVADAAGASQTLYFGPEAEPPRDLARFDMPPHPPAGLFDARFASNRMLEIHAQEVKSAVEFPILITSLNPVSVSWHIAPGAFRYSLRSAGSSSADRRALSGDGRWALTADQAASLRLRVEGGQLPEVFALRQNFPNPFNPTTLIRYELPVGAYVTLTVYDLLGREVGRLVDGKQDAGFHEVQFSAENLSSGIYFYRLAADRNVAVQKMMVVK